MGKASRKRHSSELSGASKKLLKQLKRESKPEVFVVDGKMVYYNPLKKLLEGEVYKSYDGFSITNEMVKKYEAFLKARIRNEKIAKSAGVDPEEIE